MDIEQARAKLRRAQVRTILYTVWPRPLGAGLIAESLPADLQGSPDALAQALRYLTDRGHVACSGSASRDGAALYALTANGVDRVEAGDRDPGAVRAVRMLRLRVLQALSWGGPAALGLSLIAVALQSDTDLDLSEPSIRRALAYLTDPARALACESAPGLYRISANGIDYLEGAGLDCVGVARPQDW